MPPPPSIRSSALAFLLVYVSVFLMSAAWAIATPLFGGPDEPAHIARAVSLARGQLVGTPAGTADDPSTLVRIPASYAATPPRPCFVFKPEVPASCLRLPDSPELITASTYVGRYPPLYYAVVGVGSLLTTSPDGIYVMRLISAALDALLIALGVLAVTRYSKRRLLVIGALVAATPMVWFLNGVVNPNGLEIAAAICLWCSATVLILERMDDPPAGLIAITATSLAVLTLTRAISPLWVPIIIGVLVLMGGVRNTLRSLRHHRLPLLIPAIYVVAAVPALLWTFSQHAFDLVRAGVQIAPATTNARILELSFGDAGAWLKQMVGIFGWLDTEPPGLTYVVWGFCVSSLVLLGFVMARLRWVAVVLLLGGLLIAVPAVAQYSDARQVGLVWQGRYSLPLAAGVPVLCTWLIDRAGILASLRGRLVALVLTCAAIGDVIAFCEALRRYAVGTDGSLDYFHGPWQPPLGSFPVTLLSVGATILVFTVVPYASGVWTRPERYATTGATLTSSPAR